MSALLDPFRLSSALEWNLVPLAARQAVSKRSSQDLRSWHLYEYWPGGHLLFQLGADAPPFGRCIGVHPCAGGTRAAMAWFHAFVNEALTVHDLRELPGLPPPLGQASEQQLFEAARAALGPPCVPTPLMGLHVFVDAICEELVFGVGCPAPALAETFGPENSLPFGKHHPAALFALAATAIEALDESAATPACRTVAATYLLFEAGPSFAEGLPDAVLAVQNRQIGALLRSLPLSAVYEISGAIARAQQRVSNAPPRYTVADLAWAVLVPRVDRLAQALCASCADAPA